MDSIEHGASITHLCSCLLPPCSSASYEPKSEIYTLKSNMSDSDSSDDDIAKLIARTRQEYPTKRQREEQSKPSGNGQSDKTVESEDDDSSFELVAANSVITSKLKHLKQQRRIRERSSILLHDVQDSSSDDDDDEAGDNLTALPSRKPDHLAKDENKMNVSINVYREEDAVEVLSSDDEEGEHARRMKTRGSSKELQALQAAHELLTSAQRQSSISAVASPSLSPVSRRRLSEEDALEEWTLQVQCKLMRQDEVQVVKEVQLQLWNSSTISELHGAILQACDLNRNAAIVSSLTWKDVVIGKTTYALGKSIRSVSPSLGSGSVLHATLHLTGLQMTAKEKAHDTEEVNRKKFGRSVKVCLRRMLDRKEEREAWTIREKEPFSSLINSYSEKHQVRIKLKFDGETIGPERTPHDFDMEDEDLIDVIEESI